MNKKPFPIRCALTILIISLNACVVVPKQTASYDQKCKVAVQKVTLDVEYLESDNNWSCTNNYCAWDISAEIAEAVFTTASSTIISGSIALAGNTAYWLESDGECPNDKPINNQEPGEQPEKNRNEYVIEEEIITAKS